MPDSVQNCPNRIASTGVSYICKMTGEPTNPIDRSKVVPLLLRRFVKDYQDAIKEYDLPQKLELTEHLLYAISLILWHARTGNENIYTHFLELEDELLKKYRKKLKPYFTKYFFQYFWFDEVLIHKEIYTKEEFNRLPLEQKRLTLEEITDFVERCQDILYYTRSICYLQMEPEKESGIKAPETETEPELLLAETDKDITLPRQLLAIYFLLQAGWGIDRASHPVSAAARMAHLLTGKKFSKIQNSEIYKKYGEMPQYNKGQKLIADLLFIRPCFEELQISKAVELIDAEINNVKNSTRKKLGNSDKK